MKTRRMVTLLGMTALAVLIVTGCPTDGGGGGVDDITTPEGRLEHLAMLKNLGVNVNPDLPVAPNGRPYNPQTSAAGRQVAAGPERSLGPLGKTFSRPKREIFVAGYFGIEGKNHALYEDYENSALAVIGQDSKDDTGWSGGGIPRKSVAADLDGDGVDEVVIVTLVPSTDKILINKGEYKNNVFTVTQIRELTAPKKINDMVPYDANSLSYIGWTLIAADLNGDGKQECVFTLPSWDGAYLYILDHNLAVIKNAEDLKPVYAANHPDGRCFPMVTAADYDQDGKDELCLMFGLNVSGFNAPYVILDDMDANFVELHKGTITSATASMKIGNVVSGDFTGDGLPDTVFYGPRSTSGEKILMLLKTSLDSSFRPVFEWVPSATKPLTSEGYVIPRLVAGNVDGDRQTDIFAFNRLYTLNSANEFVQMTGTDYAFTSTYNDLYDVVMGDVTGDQRDDVVYFCGGGRIEIYYYSSGQYRRSGIKQIAGSSHHETGCLPNVDNDSFILRDTGERELLFTNPQVIAALASPPYYTGINEDGDGGTSFGYSKSSGTSSSNSFGFSVGVSVGAEFKLPLIGGTEVEATMKTSFSWAQSNSIEISESWGWNNPLAQDLVIFTAVPFDVYYYEVVSSPPGEDAEPGDIITVNVPRKPRPYHLPLPTYNAGVPEEDRITVNHTLGNPGSYYTTTQRDAQKRQAGDKGLFSTTTQMTAGAGNGSTTINIESVSTEESSFAFDLEAEVTAKVTAGSVTVGASAGFSYGYETTSSVSAGTYIEGTVPAIPIESYNNNLDFNWGLMAYPKTDLNQKYIFVTYWTRLYD